jgi:hypothetical protein
MSSGLNEHVCDLVCQRHAELLRVMETRQLLRRAKAGNPPRGHLYGRWLAWLGARLVAWGWRLQEHNGVPTPSDLRRA